MKLLLDTHALLWFLRDDPQLSINARALICDSGNDKYVSIATCWEIAIKTGLGKLTLSEPAGALLAREIPRNGFHELSIELRHAARVETLPMYHRDPFDRLLVAQAILEEMVIVSTDSQLDQYGVPRYW